MRGVSEQIVTFGRERNLVGIVTRPKGRDVSGTAAVLILNTGIVHRVGHGRMYVDLSRRLAGMGRIVLRFDLSGLGDSDARKEARPPLDAGLTDIKEAIDFLQAACNVSRAVIMGLCSGANFAIAYGGSDPRVEKLILMDPIVPRTARYYLQYYSRRLSRLSTWGDLMTGRHPVWRAVARASGLPQEEAEVPATNGVNAEVRAYLEKAYRSAVDADLRMLAIFTAGMQHQHCYRGQLIDAFPEIDFRNTLHIEYLEIRDHTFSFEKHRSHLFDIICDWLATDPDLDCVERGVEARSRGGIEAMKGVHSHTQ